MDSRSLRALEFSGILEALSGLAASPAGVEACLKLRPYADIKDISRETEVLREVLEWTGESRVKPAFFPDLEGLFERMGNQHALIDADGLWAVLRVLNHARQIANSIQSFGPDRLTQLKGRLPGPAQKTAQALGRCLSDDGTLKDESSPELFSVRREIRRIHQVCSKKVKDYVAAEDISSLLQDDFMTISSDRYVLPLKTNFKGRIQGIIHDYSGTGETCYFEPMFLIETNNRLQELKQEEREAEAAVYRYLTGIIRQESELVEGVFRWLVDMDVWSAKARFAEVIRGRPVEMEKGAGLCLSGARNPILALSGEAVSEIDLELKSGQKGLIISGGNAGGKTVALKTLGLIAVMAAHILPVPVRGGSILPFWSKIYVFIGDEQSIEDHLSTFTGQIRHLSRVFEAVDAETLVILDEFGAGTDPTQGAALAQAVIDSLLDNGAWLASATHFPALKVYAVSRPGVRAASVIFDPGTGKPLYKLAYDQVGASMALNAAREHGLPETILRRAEEYLLLDGSDSTKLIERLNELAVERERELGVLRREARLYEEKRARLNERFEREKKAVLEELRETARTVAKEWREGRIARKEAMKRLSDAAKGLEKRDEIDHKDSVDPERHWDALKIGGHARYVPWDKPGCIREKDEKKKAVKFDMEGVALWVKPEELKLTEARDKSASAVRTDAGRSGSNMPLRLDMRGFRVEEAEAALLRFIDQAVLKGLNTLEIVHGRGTGALRRLTSEFLASCPAVATFSTADEEHGGDGLTLVDLK